MRNAYPDAKTVYALIPNGIRQRNDSDRSAEILIFLALAIQAMRQLKLEEGEAFPELNGSPLLFSSLERAYREAILLRTKLPLEVLTNKTKWPVIISRFGNAYER